MNNGEMWQMLAILFTAGFVKVFIPTSRRPGRRKSTRRRNKFRVRKSL